MTTQSNGISLKDQSKYYSKYYTYVKPVFRSPIIQLYGTYTLTIIAIIVFIVFAIKPTVETITLLQKKLEDSRSVLEQVTKKSTDLSAAKNNLDKLDANTKKKINSAVPNSISLQSVIQSLEQTAKTNQASISALQFQPLTIENTPDGLQNNTLGTVDFTFNLEGSYPTLIKMIDSIQQSSRLISIDNLIMNKSGDGNIIVLSVTGKAYYLK